MGCLHRAEKCGGLFFHYALVLQSTHSSDAKPNVRIFHCNRIGLEETNTNKINYRENASLE